MGEFSLVHWLFILAILLLFFGPSRLPQLGKSLGTALRGFKEGLNETTKEAGKADPNAQITSAKNEREVNQTENSGHKNS